jgi:hypothetical protein
MPLVERRCNRFGPAIQSVTALYRCPNCQATEVTIADHVPQDAALWHLYRGASGKKRWHLWIAEIFSPARPIVSPISACGCADVVTHPDRITGSPTTRERVCQLCRCLAEKFGITLPKGARR